jgi:hypothetical protein
MAWVAIGLGKEAGEGHLSDRKRREVLGRIADG